MDGVEMTGDSQAALIASGQMPLVTFALFAYNQEKYIREAVEGALAQDYPNLEIIISDDCSTDGTFQVITKLANDYAGPHKLRIQQNERNTGLATHISLVMQKASGELVVAAAGDDVSYPSRTRRVVEQWLVTGKRSGSIFSYVDTIDGLGNVRRLERTAHVDSYQIADRDTRNADSLCVGTLGCAHAWSKDIFDIFGELDAKLIHEDITIPLRSIMVGAVTFIHEPLVLYRLNASSLSKHGVRNSRERLVRMEKYWAARGVNYRQFDTDLARAHGEGFISEQDAVWLKSIVDRHRAEAAFNHAFFSGGRIARLKMLFFSAPRTMPAAQKAKLLAVAIAPSLYGFRARLAI